MKPVWGLAKIFGVCFGITFSVIGVVVLLAVINDKPETVKEEQHKQAYSPPIWHPSNDMMGSLNGVEYTKMVE